MALNAWEFAYNDLTFGGDNDIGLTNVEGLSPPDLRVDEIERASDHGSFIFAQWLSSRTITFEGDIIGNDTTDFNTKIDSLRAAFSPQAAPLPLQFSIPGGVDKRVYCVPSRLVFPVNVDYSMQMGGWSAELRAEDPRIYSETYYNYDIGPYIENGITFNITFNVNFGGTSGGGLSQTLTNNGTIGTFPYVVFQGPAVNPKLRNLTTGETLALNINLASTDIFVVDFQARTIMQDAYSRYSSLDISSTWWQLAPGDNVIKLEAGSTTGSTKATVSYRDAWN